MSESNIVGQTQERRQILDRGHQQYTRVLGPGFSVQYYKLKRKSGHGIGGKRKLHQTTKISVHANTVTNIVTPSYIYTWCVSTQVHFLALPDSVLPTTWISVLVSFVST